MSPDALNSLFSLCIGFAFAGALASGYQAMVHRPAGFGLLQQGVAVTLPRATNSVEKPETQGQTVVTIAANKQVYVNAIEVQGGNLRRRIEEIIENQTDKIVIIKADEDVEYGAVMQAMDDLRAGGIEDMGLITETRRGDNNAFSQRAKGGE